MPQKNYLASKAKLPKKKVEESSEEEKKVSRLPENTTVKETFSLYVRGPNWIKDRENALTKLQEINSKIKAVRHPRQKHTDFCFIDFASASDRDAAFEELKDNKQIHVKPSTKDTPKQLTKRKKKVEEKREAKLEARKVLREIKKAEKRKEASKKTSDFTNQMLITNLPSETTTAELKQQFDSVVEVNLKLAKKGRKYNSAILTFATPHEAREAVETEVTMHDHKLNKILNSNKFYIQQKKLNKRKQKLASQGKEDSTKKQRTNSE